MATFLFSQAVADPSLVANFNPANDFLVFSDDAADIKVSPSGTSTVFTVGAESVTLPVALAAVIGAGVGSFIVTANGTGLVVGDNTANTSLDDINNQAQLDQAQANDFTTNGDDQLIGLGGNDIMDGGQGNDIIYGNTGADQLQGALANSGADIAYGGQGNDVINY